MSLPGFPSLGFAWPEALALLLLLPLLRMEPLRVRARAPGAIVLPFAVLLPPGQARGGGPFRSRDVRAVAHSLAGFVVFVLLILAAARPQHFETVDARPASGRDLLVLLDVSASMTIRDLQGPNGALGRLQAAQHFGRAFVVRRPGDRVALTVFAEQPYAYVPLTYDLQAVGRAITDASPGLAGQQTALGDAVAAGVRSLTGIEGPSPQAPEGAALILVSDGENTAGRLSVAQAAWLAEQRRVPIYALGVGAAGRFPDLEALATQSGGFLAAATDARGVADFFSRIEAIESARRRPSAPVLRARELYPWLLGPALALVLAGLVLRTAGRGRAAP